MSDGTKAIIVVVAFIVVLHFVMRWLDPSPRCYDDDQCADLRELEMER